MRSATEWRAIFEALGPSGDDSLVLLLARHQHEGAACGSAYIGEYEAGRYSFARRIQLRRRGLASALVDAAHREARARGAMTAVLEARPDAISVYERAGYKTERTLQLFTFG
jgi:ribosomal protein S18 acetylase RimI-like enzyme